jgi:hypothetical protein
MRRHAACFAAGLLTLAASVAQAQSDEARDWLERMSNALATRNYDGLFTHSTAGQTESMRIVHRVAKGQSLERLVSLDGSGREIVRTSEEVHAYLPDRKVVLVEPRGDDGSLLKALPVPGPTLDSPWKKEGVPTHSRWERETTSTPSIPCLFRCGRWWKRSEDRYNSSSRPWRSVFRKLPDRLQMPWF